MDYLNEKYSTTRLLIKEKPIIENKPEDKFETIMFLPEKNNRKGEGGLRTKGYFKKSYSDRPLVSIITVVFNGEKYLDETIQSVITQSCDNVEYIIIDGGSNDGTLDIIKKYEDQIDYWVSEEDTGIYDAMNKGLRLAMGEYVGILNADDYYVKDAVEHSIKKILKTNSDYSFANVEYVNSKTIAKAISPLKKDFIYQEMFYPHVSAFILLSVYKSIGLFDTSLKIAGDHDMALHIHLKGYSCVYIDKVVARIEEGGVSSSLDTNKEFYMLSLKHGKNKILASYIYVLQVLSISVAKMLPNMFVRIIRKIKGSRFS